MVSVVLGMLWCGMIGLVFSLAAYADHRAVEYKKASYKRKWAWCCAITGIVLFVLIVTAVVLAATVFEDDTKDFLCDNWEINCD